MLTDWLQRTLSHVAGWFPPGSWLCYQFNVNGLVAVVLVSVICGVAGLWLSNTVRLPIGRGTPIDLEPSGAIVVLSVLTFFVTMAVKSWQAGRFLRGRGSLAAVGAPVENASIAEPAAGGPA